MDGRCVRIARAETLSVSQDESDGSFTVKLSISPAPDGGHIDWVAAAPPERRASEAGSCLPFVDERMAFEGPHAMRGTARAERIVAGTGAGTGDGSAAAAQSQAPSASPVFTVRLRAIPNAFYAGLGTERVPPAVFVYFSHGGKRMRGAAKVTDGVPFRTLTYPALRPCASSSLYDVPARPVRSQADILFASAFPTMTLASTRTPAASAASPAKFWGGKPPV